MNWLTGIVVYILVWWVTLFAILPLWVTPTDPDDPGYAAGAPQNPLLLRKLLLTTAVAAVIDNARRIQQLRASHGSFHAWLEAHHPRPAAEWTQLFRQTFRFTGGLIVGEFLMSLGYLAGAHEPDCPVYPRILALAPPWSRAVPPPAN